MVRDFDASAPMGTNKVVACITAQYNSKDLLILPRRWRINLTRSCTYFMSIKARAFSSTRALRPCLTDF